MKRSIGGYYVRIRLRENIMASLTQGTASQLCALRDHLEDYSVACGRGTEKPIQSHLLLTLLPKPATDLLQGLSIKKVQTGYIIVFFTLLIFTKKNFFKVTHTQDD